MKEKIKLTFLRVFDNPFSKILFLKVFVACNDYFGLFTKIKKESGTSFSVIPFFLLKISDKMCYCKLLFRQLMMSQTLRLILDQALKQWLTERKRGEDGNTKIWISWEQYCDHGSCLISPLHCWKMALLYLTLIWKVILLPCSFSFNCSETVKVGTLAFLQSIQ